jgi:hypothetical protein
LESWNLANSLTRLDWGAPTADISLTPESRLSPDTIAVIPQEHSSNALRVSANHTTRNMTMMVTTAIVVAAG